LSSKTNIELEHQGNMILSQHKSKSKQEGNIINRQNKQLKEQEMS